MTVPRQVGRVRGAVLAACGGWLAGCTPGPIDAIDLDPTYDHLLAHWSFDDGTGMMVADSSGRGHDGVIIAGGWITAAHFGGGLHLEGGTAMAPIRSGVSVAGFPPATDSSWTVAGWVRTPRINTGPNYATIVSTESLGGGGWQLNLRMDLDAVPPDVYYQFAYYTGPDRGNNVVHNCIACVGAPDEWVHLAGVVDRTAATLSFYKNGVLDGPPEPATAPIKAGSNDLYFGRWPSDDTRNLTGELDDFVIYNRALSKDEIRALVNAPLINPR